MSIPIDPLFWKDKKIFITGHTGFKGSWLCAVLLQMGAAVTGYALEPHTQPSLFCIAGIEKQMDSVYGDIRDRERLLRCMKKANPEIVLHMAAQPIVSESYKNPLDTYAVNVMGTVNVLECLRALPNVRSFINVTTDKVYRNAEQQIPSREQDALGGLDPYSGSKACSEIVTQSYLHSFLEWLPVSTARAGNVIGGGDFAKDRILPDCVRAARQNRPIVVRNPHSIRPYQHVLDPLFAYLALLEGQYKNPGLAGHYNVGPDEAGCIETKTLVNLFCRYWGNGQTWRPAGSEATMYESGCIKLDCTRLKDKLSWRPKWSVEQALKSTVEWEKIYWQKGDSLAVMERQIRAFVGNE